MKENIELLNNQELAYICYNVKKTENKDHYYTSKVLKPSEDYDEEKAKELFKDLTDSEKEVLNRYTSNDLSNYIMNMEHLKRLKEDQERKESLKNNPFLLCIENNYNKFHGELLGYKYKEYEKESKIRLSWKSTCKELLVESIKIYCTPYKKEYYFKDGNKLKYIGNDYETYLEHLYTMVDFEYTTLIPFSSFISTIKSIRVFETLKPNRDYILFNDCLLNINTGETFPVDELDDTKVPYAIIDYDYLIEDPEVQEYIFKLFDRIDTDNIIKSLMYGMFNKRVLKKTSSIFNIQPSDTGKTLIVKPFTEIGLFNNVNHEMLKGNDKYELFKQYYVIVFEEIQETVINGSGFNSLCDNTSMAVQRKYKEAIIVPKELKPVVYINGESMANFKGRTKGSFNRFLFIPNYKEKLTEYDNDYITENALVMAVELIRHLINYMKTVSKDVITDNILKAKKTEKELFELKENKVRITFEYIKQDPIISSEKVYCISETILIEIIFELQNRGIITVDLFNQETSIRRFIRNTIVNNLDTNIGIDNDNPKKIKKDGKSKPSRLKYMYQLTEKGKAIVTDLGYSLESLKC